MNTYNYYIAWLYADEEEAIIRGKVLNTRGTITFYGKTVGEALQAFRDSVDDYLDFCKEAGVEPDQELERRRSPSTEVRQQAEAE